MHDHIRTAFDTASHIPQIKDIIKLHFQMNAFDITAQKPTLHKIMLQAKMRF